jgi:hypothetical protein
MEANRPVTCAYCAERIGTYEPVWWHRPDGTLAPTSLLRARDDPGFETAGSSFFHQGCLASAGGDAVPN